MLGQELGRSVGRLGSRATFVVSYKDERDDESIDAAAAVPMDGFFVFITEAGIIAARNSDEVSSVDKMD